MYKVSIARLKALKDALEESNRLLIAALDNPTEASYGCGLINRVEKNVEQIKMIEDNFYIE